MKKVFLLLCLLATTTIATATDLWEGTHAVDWSNTLTIFYNLAGQRVVNPSKGMYIVNGKTVFIK
ncbi:MAG: hypothetical protein IJ887_02440 [Prevotella sp.]|nr:hypothetical protein [Prevotella sp.]MBR6188177.1 hypothetical protein [Prevotella sp.]